MERGLQPLDLLGQLRDPQLELSTLEVGILGAALRRPSGADVAPGRSADRARARSQVIREKPRRPGQHLERPQVRRALCLGERSPVPVVVLVDEPLEIPPELRPLGERARDEQASVASAPSWSAWRACGTQIPWDRR